MLAVMVAKVAVETGSLTRRQGERSLAVGHAMEVRPA